MEMKYDDAAYAAMIDKLFVRFPSFQKVGNQAYKPGIDNMLFFDQLAGHPHRKYETVHVAGTNGKGSVCNIIASVLAASGLKTGLYTSPHILDFRERMRILDGRKGSARAEYIGKEAVWDFVRKWSETFEHLDLSFFEITTMMAFDWFASQDVDIAVIETGLGGRFDSTNIISPVVSVITNIGLDHCDMLGNTLGEIAFEKAGIIKPKTPAVIGESNPETDPVFERKVLYTNLPEPEYMGNTGQIMSLLTFADRTEPSLWHSKAMILKSMDLQGEYQEKNLRTVLATLDELASERTASLHPVLKPLSEMLARARNSDNDPAENPQNASPIEYAIEHTASRLDFHGRWERLCTSPDVIADIGHNAHGLKYNFAQIEHLLDAGKYSDVIIIYGIVADKDLDAVFPLMPKNANYIFTNASGKRALPASELLERYLSFMSASENGTERKTDAAPASSVRHLNARTAVNAESAETVSDAVAKAFALAGKFVASDPESKPLIYIGGSTFIVSEAISAIKNRK